MRGSVRRVHCVSVARTRLAITEPVLPQDALLLNHKDEFGSFKHHQTLAPVYQNTFQTGTGCDNIPCTKSALQSWVNLRPCLKMPPPEPSGRFSTLQQRLMGYFGPLTCRTSCRGTLPPDQRRLCLLWKGWTCARCRHSAPWCWEGVVEGGG